MTMDAKTLALHCAQKSLEKKAENVLILDLEKNSSVADFFVIVSGATDRQVIAIANHISDSMRAESQKTIHEEGLSDGRWVLLDFGNVIVHVFQEALRDFYNLEGLWPNAPRQPVFEETVPGNYGSGQESAHF